MVWNCFKSDFRETYAHRAWARCGLMPRKAHGEKTNDVERKRSVKPGRRFLPSGAPGWRRPLTQDVGANAFEGLKNKMRQNGARMENINASGNAD